MNLVGTLKKKGTTKFQQRRLDMYREREDEFQLLLKFHNVNVQ